jgi:hypothetical protein
MITINFPYTIGEPIEPEISEWAKARNDFVRRSAEFIREQEDKRVLKELDNQTLADKMYAKSMKGKFIR